MEGFKNLFHTSEFLRERERISSKFVDNLGTRLQTFVSPVPDGLQSIM